jgi:hypothetical protein
MCEDGSCGKVTPALTIDLIQTPLGWLAFTSNAAGEFVDGALVPVPADWSFDQVAAEIEKQVSARIPDMRFERQDVRTLNV